jgi:REP element-mobilizing transposase RayT
MHLIHHVVARAADGARLFADDADRASYLERLGAVAERYGWRCLGYCLMNNHTHLLVESSRAELRVGVRRLRRAHAQALGLRHGHASAVWSPACRPVRVRSDRQLWAAAAYVAANPVDAGLCAVAADWRWSSHAAVLGLAPAPPFLDVDRLLELLGGPTGAEPRARYARYVADRGRRVKAGAAPWERA